MSTSQTTTPRTYTGHMAPLVTVDAALTQALHTVRHARTLADLQTAMARINAAGRNLKRMFTADLPGEREAVTTKVSPESFHVKHKKAGGSS